MTTGDAGDCADQLPDLPRRVRVVRVDFGAGPDHPVICYTAPAEVIASVAAALRDWDPGYRVSVDPIPPDPAAAPPMLPNWRLFTGE